MLGNSYNDLSKYYNGSSPMRPIRAPGSHLEATQTNYPNKHTLIETKLNHTSTQKNDRKLDTSTSNKKLVEDTNTNSSPSNNTCNYNNNNSHPQKKVIDTLNDKNMCNFIFQQHLSLKSQPTSPFQKFDSRDINNNKIEKPKIIDTKQKEGYFYPRSPSPFKQAQFQKKPSPESVKYEKTTVPTMNKMPPPLHPNMPPLLSPPSNFGAKQLSKLKRFLTTLQQFAIDISPETGERVRHLVLNLVNSAISIEEFHTKLQEATNFPLRPFVIPFLRANLPLLQYELLNFARLSKMNSSDFLNQNADNFLFNENSMPPNPSPNQFTPSYPSNETVNNKLKRKSPDNEMVAPPPNKKTSQNLPLLYISPPVGSLPGQNQQIAQPTPFRPRPSPPQAPVNIPVPQPPGVQYPMQNGNIQKQQFPNPQLLQNHITNFMNNHNNQNSPSSNGFYHLANNQFQHRESHLQQIFNGTRNSPIGQPSPNLNHHVMNNLINNLSPNQSSLLIPNHMNGKNFVTKQEEIAFKETRGSESKFFNCMKEFEQDFGDLMDMTSVESEFKNIDTMLSSIFEMVERTQKILDTLQSKANKLKKQKEIYENELKKTFSEFRDEASNIENEYKKKSDEKKANDSFHKESKQKKDENQTDSCCHCGHHRIAETCPRCYKAKYCSKYCMNKNWELTHYKSCSIETKSEKNDDKEIDLIETMSHNEESFNDSDKQENISLSFSKSDEENLQSISENSFSKSKDLLLDDNSNHESKKSDKNF